MGLLQPDKLFSSLASIDIEWDLLRRGLGSVLLDIDNTIRRRDNDEVPYVVRRWLLQAENKGIKLCLLSNNFHNDIFELSRELSIPIVGKAMKPLPQGYHRACQLLEVEPSECVMVGDQLFTDVLGAHLFGMKAYLVRPLVEADLKHTLILRRLENCLINNREPEEVPSEGYARFSRTCFDEAYLSDQPSRFE